MMDWNLEGQSMDVINQRWCEFVGHDLEEMNKVLSTFLLLSFFCCCNLDWKVG